MVSVGLCSCLEALGENLLSCLSLLLKVAYFLCLAAPSIYEVSNGRLNLLISHHSDNESSASLFHI